jgi:nitroreductase
LEKLQETLAPANSWVKKSPVLILSVAKLKFTLNNQPNRHAQHDVGLAAENMVLQAQALGLASHQMAGFSVDKAMELFGIPYGDYEPMALISIFYAAPPETLENQQLREREMAQRERKPLQEIVFSKYWNGAFPYLHS